MFVLVDDFLDAEFAKKRKERKGSAEGELACRQTGANPNVEFKS